MIRQVSKLEIHVKIIKKCCYFPNIFECEAFCWWLFAKRKKLLFICLERD